MVSEQDLMRQGKELPGAPHCLRCLLCLLAPAPSWQQDCCG